MRVRVRVTLALPLVHQARALAHLAQLQLAPLLHVGLLLLVPLVRVRVEG